MNKHWLLLGLFLSGFQILAAMGRGESFYPKNFVSYLESRAETEYEQTIVDRILNLKLEMDQLKEVVSRIPFLTAQEKLHLFRILDEYKIREHEKVITAESAGELGYVEIEEEKERKKILKRYLLEKIRNEQDYGAVIHLFQDKQRVMEIYQEVKDLSFLNEEDIKMAGKIARGKLEAFFTPKIKREYRFEQLGEFSTVSTKGFTSDSLKREDTYGRYKHRFRTVGEYHGREFVSDIIVEGGNTSLRREDDGQLEFIRLELQGDQSHSVLGDFYEPIGSQTLNREIRGLKFARKINSSIPTELIAFGGAHLLTVQDLNNSYIDYIEVAGLSLKKTQSKERNWSFNLMASRESRDLGRRRSEIFSLNHETALSRELTLKAQASTSYGDRLPGLFRRSHALEFDLLYDDEVYRSRLYAANFSKGYFSLLGEDIEDATLLEGMFGKTETWGHWNLAAQFQSNSADSLQSGLDILRPSMGLHWNQFLGFKDLTVNYHYLESQEEASDNLVLQEYNFHQLFMTQSFHRVHIDGDFGYREKYDKLIDIIPDREFQWNLSTRGYFIYRGRQVQPRVYVGGERLHRIGGRIDVRTSAGIEVDSQILRRGQLYARYSINKNRSQVLYQEQLGREAELSFDYPFQSDWRKSLKFSVRSDEQELSDQLSFGSNSEFKVAYNNSF